MRDEEIHKLYVADDELDITMSIYFVYCVVHDIAISACRYTNKWDRQEHKICVSRICPYRKMSIYMCVAYTL